MRWTLPAASTLLAFAYFLPKTAANCNNRMKAVEQAHVPSVAHLHAQMEGAASALPAYVQSTTAQAQALATTAFASAYAGAAHGSGLKLPGEESTSKSVTP